MVPNEKNGNKMEKTPLAEAGESAAAGSGQRGSIMGVIVQGR